MTSSWPEQIGALQSSAPARCSAPLHAPGSQKNFAPIRSTLQVILKFLLRSAPRSGAERSGACSGADRSGAVTALLKISRKKIMERNGPEYQKEFKYTRPGLIISSSSLKLICPLGLVFRRASSRVIGKCTTRLFCAVLYSVTF